ncbi:unnamed protein product, partial [Brachionus calyciflorus]
LVFARTDAEHKIHPVAFCLSSHEQATDFSEFYTGLINLADDLCVEFDPEYIVQDACDASYNAAVKLFENFKILIVTKFTEVMLRMAKYYSVRQQNFDTIPVPDSKAKKYGKIFSIQKYFKCIDKESWKFTDSKSNFREVSKM